MNTIRSERVQKMLERLHQNGRNDVFRALSWIPPRVSEFFQPERLTHSEGVAKRAKILRDSFLGITKQQGDLLYTMVRLKRPELVIEFGASMGISTLYLSSALQDNGHGKMITTELEPDKCERVRKHLEEAGLQKLVEIRAGDARETLKDTDEDVDFLFLDGWKSLYLPVFSILEENLRPGAMILADDTRKKLREIGPFLTYMLNPNNGYVTVDLNVGHGMSLSVRT